MSAGLAEGTQAGRVPTDTCVSSQGTELPIGLLGCSLADGAHWPG